MKLTCKNCNQHFSGNFCNHCGQTASTHDINFHSLMHELQHGILHIDKGIFFTTKQLFTRPGHAIREYMLGKRVRHFKPLAYVFILSTIYALCSNVAQVDTFMDEIYEGFSDGGKSKVSMYYKMLSDIIVWLKSHYAYSSIIFLPFVSLASFAAFNKNQMNYWKHFILNAFATGQRTVLYLLFLPIVSFISNEDIISDLQNAELFLGIVLTIWTYNQFFIRNSTIINVLLTLLTYLLTAIIFFAVIIILMLVQGIVVAII